MNQRDIGGSAQPLLNVEKLVKHFPVKGGLGKHSVVRAVDGINFVVHKGETLGVVGESGCGKSTMARLLMQLLRQDSGELVFDAIRGATRRGAAVICASSDYEQLAMLCDRVLVFSNGRIGAELQGEQISKQGIAETCLRGAPQAAGSP